MGDAVLVKPSEPPSATASRPRRSPAFTRSTASTATSNRRSARTRPPLPAARRYAIRTTLWEPRADGGTTLTGTQPPGAPDLDSASAFLAAAGLRLTHVAGDRVEGVIDSARHTTPLGRGPWQRLPQPSGRRQRRRDRRRVETAAKSRWAPTTTRPPAR